MDKKVIIIKKMDGKGDDMENVVKKIMGKKNPIEDADELLKMFGDEDKEVDESYEEEEPEKSKEYDLSEDDEAIKEEAMKQDNLRDALKVLVKGASDEMLAECIDDVMEKFV
jgi:hypothetical protein